MASLEEQISLEVKKDKVVNFYKKNKKKISNYSFIVLVAAGGYFFWKSRQKEARIEASQSLHAALNYSAHNQNENALKTLENIAKKTGYTYADLAKFFGAFLLEKQQKVEESIAVLEKIIEKAEQKQLKSLASLYLARLRIDSRRDLDKADSALKLFLHEQNPWFSVAAELYVALLVERKQFKEAISFIEKSLKNKALLADTKERLLLVSTHFHHQPL